MCIATFVAILDTTVVNLALHAIQSKLHAGITTLQWVLDLYNLTYASFIMTGGILGDLFGRRRIFAVGMCLFTLGSLVCGLAPNPSLLIAGRGIAGIGAALQLPGSLSILNITFQDEKERAHAIAIWGGFNGLAMAIGPTIGGLLVDHFGWRTVFFLVVPFGIVVIGLSLARISESSDPKGRQLDSSGQIFAFLCLGCLAFGFIQGPSLSWLSPWIIASFFVCVISFIGFLKTERGKSGALVSLEVFRDSMFSAAMTDAALMTFGMYALLFIFPLYLQSVRGQTAVIAGLELLPMSFTFFVVSLFAVRFVNLVGPRLAIAIGLALTGVGIGALAFVHAQSSFVPIWLGLFGIGIGLGLITGPIMTIAVSRVPRERSGMSSGLVNVARMVGATLGVAILGSIFGARLDQTTHNIPKFLSGMHRALAIGGSGEIVAAAIALIFMRSDSKIPAKSN
jgi:MFS transporter, DHA2 family, methylenomycin A resistance protein